MHIKRKVTAILLVAAALLGVAGLGVTTAAPAGAQCVSVVVQDLGWHPGKVGSLHGASWAYPAYPCGPLNGIHYVIDWYPYAGGAYNGAWDIWVSYPLTQHYWHNGSNGSDFGEFYVDGKTVDNGVWYAGAGANPAFHYPWLSQFAGSAIERPAPGSFGVQQWPEYNAFSRVWFGG